MNVHNFLRVFLLSIIITAMIFVLTMPSQSMEEEQYTINTPYEYPVIPGTPEWLELESNMDMINVCRVPEALVGQMSTEALLKTYLTHPLVKDIFAYNSYNSGFQVLKDHYSMGLDELLQREDLSEAVRAEYSRIDVSTKLICNVADAEVYLKTYNKEIEDKYRMCLLEILAAEMDEQRKSIELVNALLDKNKEKEKNSTLYGSGSPGIYAKVLEERYREEVIKGK